MPTNDELARLGEPPATPEEEAMALRLEEDLQRARRGDPTPSLPATAEYEMDLEIAETLQWLVAQAPGRADAWELEELGRLFPQFEPIRRLGRGGMGVVYLVRHLGL